MSRGSTQVGVSSMAAGRGVPSLGRYIGTSGNVSVTSGGSNSAGAWTQLVAATSAETQVLVVTVSGTFVSTAAAPALLDIGVGAAAAEVAVVSSIACGQVGTLANLSGASWVLPICIPAGARLSCRLTNAHASPPVANVRCHLYESGRPASFRSPSKLVAIGADVANSKGVDITTNNTWTQVTAATNQAFTGLLLTYGGNDANMATANYQTAELGVGPSGGESSIVLSTHSTLNTESMDIPQSLIAVSGYFPAGSRVAVRASNGTTEALTAVVLGVPYA